jgi:hypothetical protein
MYPTLASASVTRALAVADLAIPDSGSGACGLHAALPAPADTNTAVASAAPVPVALPAAGDRALPPAPTSTSAAPAAPGSLAPPAGLMVAGPAADVMGLVSVSPGSLGSSLAATPSSTAPSWAAQVVPAGGSLPWQWASAWGRLPGPTTATTNAFPALEVELATPPAPDAGQAGAAPGHEDPVGLSPAAAPEQDNAGGWFLSLEDGGGEESWGLLVASDRIAQDAGRDPEATLAAVQAVFDSEDQ